MIIELVSPWVGGRRRAQGLLFSAFQCSWGKDMRVKAQHMELSRIPRLLYRLPTALPPLDRIDLVSASMLSPLAADSEGELRADHHSEFLYA
jgi:hypothetical protein